MNQINGVSHVMLICEDMETTVDFYVNVLGLRVKATTQTTMAETWLSSHGTRHTTKLYFLELPGGTMVVLGEVGKNDTTASSPAIDYYWPGDANPFTGASRIDHLAFNVDDLSAVEWFRQRLVDHKIDVSEVVIRDGRPRFVKSIYFYDPDGTPLEIATWDFSDPTWEEHREDNYFLDLDPVPSLPDYATAPIHSAPAGEARA